MALGKSRERIFARGLGTLALMETSPTPGSDFEDVGYLQSTEIADNTEMEDIIAETGQLVNYLEKQRVVVFTSQMMQTSADEFNLPKNAGSKVFAARYYGESISGGSFQYFILPSVRLGTGLQFTMQSGLRTFPLVVRAVVDLSLSYQPPEYVLVDSLYKLQIPGLQLFIDPAAKQIEETVTVLDLSGFARNGTLYPAIDVASHWQDGTTPVKFLRFDGSDDNLQFGDVCDDDGTSDFAFDLWFRPMNSDGQIIEILSKRSDVSNSAGFHLLRTAANKLEFELGDGDSATTITSTTSCLTNVWRHVMVFVDRNGNASLYLDGAADATPVSFAATTSGTNAITFYVGRLGGDYGQVDIGKLRWYKWAAGSLPSDYATIAANHYAGEKAQYGL